MRLSQIILLVVALVAGGLAWFLVSGNQQPVQVVEGPTKVIEEQKAQVLVAKAPIGVGQRLTADTIEWQDWPEFAVRGEYISKTAAPEALTDMAGSIARFEFFPGEPIIEAKLVKTDQGYMSAVLAKGMRGVSVHVSADSAAGGYIVPNDRVDVVLTRSGDSGGGQISETILSNVKVLAIGLRLGEAGTTGAPKDASNPSADVFQDQAIATLELDPAQGEAIINGSKVGQLSLVLRSIADFASNDAAPPQANKAIKIIRYGKSGDVMAAPPPNSELAATAQPAAFAPAVSITAAPTATVD